MISIFHFSFLLHFSYIKNMENINETKIEKIYELFKLIENNDEDTLETLIDAFGSEQQLRNALLEEIHWYLRKNNYDGDINDYNSILWYIKGLLVPRPQPLRRYVDSPEYKHREQKKVDDVLFKDLKKNIKLVIDNDKPKRAEQLKKYIIKSYNEWKASIDNTYVPMNNRKWYV